uniref:Uncharacterized protein n=1 Tax=Oryza brachyantha TaxID=4533 RepID=J3LLG4_ORYBR
MATESGLSGQRLLRASAGERRSWVRGRGGAREGAAGALKEADEEESPPAEFSGEDGRRHAARAPTAPEASGSGETPLESVAWLPWAFEMLHRSRPSTCGPGLR